MPGDNLLNENARILYKRKLLHNILLVCIFVCVLLILVYVIFPCSQPDLIIISYISLIIISGVSILLNHFKHTRIASVLALFAVFATVGQNMIVSRAVSDPVIIVIPVVILGGSLYFGRKSIVVMIIAIILMVTCIGLAEIFGVYKAAQPVTPALLVIYLSLILGASIFVRIIVVMNENYLEELVSKNKFIESQKKKLLQQLDEKNILMSELHHRVKNNLMIISSILDSKIDFLDSESSRRIFIDSIKRIEAMSSIHEKLYRSENLTDVNMHDYITDLINSFSRSAYCGQNIEYHLRVDEIKINMNKAIPLAMLINELLTNSIKYAFNEKNHGEITICLQTSDDDKIGFVYEDNGPGFDPSDAGNEAIGMALIPALAKQLKAELKTDFNSKTRYELNFRAKY